MQEGKQTSVGVALLSHSTSLRSGGWACFSGGEPFRFTSLDTLQDLDALWITSASEGAFLTDGGGDFPFLRHAGFFPTPILALAQELGGQDQEPTGDVARRLAEVAQRACSMAEALCECPGQIVRAEKEGPSTLVQGLQEHVSPPGHPGRHDHLPEEVAASFQSLFKPPAPIGQPSANDLVVRVPACRLRLAQHVFSAAIPSGEWSEVSLRDHATAEAAVRSVISQQMPAMVLVTVRGVLPRVKAAAPLTRNFTAGANRWIALPELIALSRIVEMVPRRLYVASDLLPVQASLRIPPPAFSPAAGASISAGLMAEAYMHAMCQAPAVLNRGEDKAKLAPGSIRAAWLTSIARSYMLQEAMALGEAGFSVVGFNSSHLLVAVAKRNLRALRKAIAASSFLSYPSGLKAKEEAVSLEDIRTRIASDLGVG